MLKHGVKDIREFYKSNLDFLISIQMKVSYKSLLRNFKSKPSIIEISNKLFQLGHEHELENSIFDIEITPNRGDCLSLQGLCRDQSFL